MTLIDLVEGGLTQRRGMLESGLAGLSASSLLIKTQDPEGVK